MKILFNLNHPAHFHLFKNIIAALKEKGHGIFIVIKKKDVLEDLLNQAGLEFDDFQPEGRGNSWAAIAFGFLKRDLRLLAYCRRFKPDLLVGTSVEITHVGKILGIPSVHVNEDDFDVVPLCSKLGYPWASTILAPTCCRTGKGESKTVHYHSYHELAYLHPKNFTLDPRVAEKYLPADKTFTIVRFAKLTAYHDRGIRGMDDAIALRLINLLEPYGRVVITSERELQPETEHYRLAIHPADMHHVLAHAALYIGDSQTMAAEAGVLGVPFIRFNDFVGRIGYLAELEDKYQLGYGIKTNEPDRLIEKARELLEMKDLREVFSQRRQKMLSEKIDAAKFLTWFINDYPANVKVMKDDPGFQFSFR